MDNLEIVLAHLIVRTLLPQSAAITVAVDDTLFKRSGKKVFGAAWQHDGARQRSEAGRARNVLRGGRDRRGTAVPHRPVCLPVTARL
ncbi:transposase [Streptomyces sp. NPDC007905]|uniref:transposase n=1 Tax=Streptomyces sp. NPDC007905 TaxID=3364788 RepID=UPI0036F02482